MHARFAVLGGLAMVVALVLPAPAPVQAAGASPGPRVVATFPVEGPFGAFAESLAADGAGNLYSSVTTWSDTAWNAAQVWRIGSNGKLTRYGPTMDAGILSGLAFDEDGRLYAGLITFDTDGVTSGVVRIDPRGPAVRILTLPAGTFPNGLAFHHGYLYVSDSYNGAIWRVRPRGNTNTVATVPWFADPLLAPATGWEGVNGIAFSGAALYAVNADTGSVIRIPVRSDGSAGAPSVFTTDPALVTADGVAFDTLGRLWVAVNGGGVARVARNGSVTMVVDDPAWLDYPAQPTFGTVGSSRTTLYVVNGSLDNGTPNVVAFKVGVTGAPLP